MVGYNEHENLTPNQKFIAGCISGVVTRFITQPLDVVKVRMQLQKEAKARRRPLFKVTKKIMKEEGLAALWHGHSLGQVYSVVGVSSQFFVYEMATNYVAASSLRDDHKRILVFLSGGFAGCASATILMPLEVIRVRQMVVQNQYKGILNGAREVYHSGGILAFYEGLTAALIQLGPQVGIAFAVFRYAQPRILGYLHSCHDVDCWQNIKPENTKPENLLVASSVAGSLSGFISKTITYPFELMKRRMQLASHKQDARFAVPSTSQNLIKCVRLTACLSQTYRKEGIKGFFRGIEVTIFKSQVTSIVAFTTYELACHAFRDIT